jgi:hypothetical protein
LASRRPSEWYGPTTRSTSRRWRRATSFEGVEDEAAMEHVDALAADAAGSLAEAFEEFLFPDAVDAAAPPT